ncbi:MAG TPA: hypothetical protein VKT75_15005, partial [Acidobacteriaceae bacterium]|nr:hypothetical protein [Acidobacteriaceae bacterium]
WKRTLLADGRVAVSPSFLRILNRKEHAGLDRAQERYAAFLGSRLAIDDQGRIPAARMRKGQP